MRFSSLLVLSVAISSGAAFAAPTLTAAPVSSGDALTLDSQFSVSSHVQVPGKTLKPGTYTILLKDHLSDRVILQITNANGKIESTFLGVMRRSGPTGSQGPIRIQGEKSSDALLGFTFAGGRAVEFVYPKAEAAALTSKTSEEILAIDPPSDNLHITGNQLSRQDAEIVTLWSLQVTPLAGGQKGIAAKKYSEPVAPQTAVASVTPSPTAAYVAQAPSATAVPKPVVKRVAPKPSTQLASNRVPTLKALPHTASQVPTLLLCSVLCFGLAAGSRIKRSFMDAR